MEKRRRASPGQIEVQKRRVERGEGVFKINALDLKSERLYFDP
jgi:hypothetical protein